MPGMSKNGNPPQGRALEGGVKMIRGLKANYSREFYEVDGEYICIKGTKIAVDTIKI